MSATDSLDVARRLETMDDFGNPYFQLLTAMAYKYAKDEREFIRNISEAVERGFAPAKHVYGLHLMQAGDWATGEALMREAIADRYWVAGMYLVSMKRSAASSFWRRLQLSFVYVYYTTRAFKARLVLLDCKNPRHPSKISYSGKRLQDTS